MLENRKHRAFPKFCQARGACPRAIGEMTSLANLKKETRILGLDACNVGIVIGAVVRGLYLDGVLVFSKEESLGQLGREISESKYFPELKIIMVHDPERRLDSAEIGRTTRLFPVNVPYVENTMTRGLVSRSSSYRRHRAEGLDPSELRRIPGLTQVRGGLPEPVRIAHILGKLRVFGRHHQDKR
jgi:hypothetical protein